MMTAYTCKVLAITLLLIMCCVTWGSATIYTVGDSNGWNTGVDYSSWANDKTFVVGDTLVFNYASGLHNVAEVTTSDYESCTTSNVINSDNSGTTRVELSSPGRHHFICGVPGYCSQGMKLAVTAETASSTPSTWNSYSAAGALAPATVLFLISFVSLIIKLVGF
ncbi:hypothetical protein J5N97_002929 [Dioscorea zingiberensis]|uniref:Phytocyanin domain-containing protein n=1 Tax=Dioscorea zingiberensis TaxID=325984 RepID=A0A9D5HPY6_9LILI|nr:hypothetical protein J5N97_002929 [Dioscorea zingiberensis]